MKNTSNSARTLKKFNQTINIEVQVDDIAEQLFSSMDESFKHKHIVVDAIIGTSLDHNSLSYVYNALNGHSPEIDFEVGEMIICSSIYYYRARKGGEEARNEIGVAKVTEIDLYRKDKIRLTFFGYNADGGEMAQSRWVLHTACSREPVGRVKVVGKIDLKA
jgi:hypothetical protein